MFDKLPPSSIEFSQWDWKQIKPYYDDLASREVSADTLHAWLADWTRLTDLVQETRWSLYVETTLDTADENAQAMQERFNDSILPETRKADQILKEKLIESGLEPDGFKIALRNIRSEIELFREDNLPLLAQETKLGNEYEAVMGAQTIEWDGEEITAAAVYRVLEETDRDRRKRAWIARVERRLEDRDKLNALWVKLLDVREKIAENAGFADYRAYTWEKLKRFDYTPEDNETFHLAIEEVFVPAYRRLLEKRKANLGVDKLRHWDIFVDPLGREPLKPYETAEELERISGNIFHKIDPALGARYDHLRSQNMLDLENRKGKAPGAYSVPFEARKLAFIFHNAVGVDLDVTVMLHEVGHAFHYTQMMNLPYHQQRNLDAITMEVAEVASMAMELLGVRYLLKSEGGYYNEADYARSRLTHLEQIISFLPYMAVVDGFQHWVYTHIDEARNTDNCDEKWSELWDRYMPVIDFSDLEVFKKIRWQRQIHIFTDPFYYVEYGFAQLGAVQVWRNALADQAKALKQFLHALSLGATVTIPEFYEAAGAKFLFDSESLAGLLDLIEGKMAKFEGM